MFEGWWVLRWNREIWLVFGIMMATGLFVLAVLHSLIRTKAHETKYDIIRDTVTVYKIIEREPVYIRAKAKKEYVKEIDTIIIERPYIASLDTVIHSDTFSIQYSNLHNTFELRYRLRSDTIPIHYVNTVRTEMKEREWFYDVLIVLGGFGLGYLVGRAR